MDEILKSANEELKKCKEAVNKQADLISEKRLKITEKLCSEIEILFKELGIREGVLKIEHHQTTPNLHGKDEFKFLFSANKGVSPQELKRVASGGEFARLMFCVKYVLADKTALPTIIFDEIDNGVSGEIAIQLGSMMRTMASNHQVFTISHLPQIASKGEKHYFVYKDGSNGKTVSKIKLLDADERVDEIAKMIAGDDPTIPAIESARQMLAGKI